MNWLAYLLLASTGHCAPVEQFRIESQPNARHPSKHDELRPIQWGDINFLHTTDTHGWLAGHILEREFSGDWGDFVSFADKMHALANERQVDLLLIDTGDRHDGNGLSDASKQDGSMSLPIFCEQNYDIVTIGNHELYRGAASIQEYSKIRKHFGERYVVSNVEIAIGRTWVPMGEKYRIFTTKNQKRRVLALGFLFNFEGNDKQTTRVTKVEEEINKPWFQNLLHDELPSIDYIVLAGHIPFRDFPEFDQVLSEIRKHSSTVPVSVFGGHSHIRDYRIFDDYAVGLQSGRYVETLGWASANLSTPSSPPQFSRSYLDFNQRSFEFHANNSSIITSRGQEISQRIAHIRKKLNLDEHRADIPQTYYTDRAPFPSSKSIYTLLQDKVLPLLSSPPELDERTRYIMLNTGAVRFDLFKGPFTKDSGYILSPFKNEWFYIDSVPRHVADQVLPIINGYDRVLLSYKSRHNSLHRPQQLHRDQLPADRLYGNQEREQIDLHPLHKSSFGYRTTDDLGSDGDDTIHKPWTFHPIPNMFQSIVEGTENHENVALIFHDFAASFVERALTTLGHADLFKPEFHGGAEIIDLIPDYFKYHNNK